MRIISPVSTLDSISRLAIEYLDLASGYLSLYSFLIHAVDRISAPYTYGDEHTSLSDFVV